MPFGKIYAAIERVHQIHYTNRVKDSYILCARDGTVLPYL